MISKWEEFWKQLEATDNELTDFLENGGLSSLSHTKANKFINAWNKQKKMASEIDQYISPVEPIQVEIPFKSSEFKAMWARWKEYMLEQHGQLIKSRSELSALEHLRKITKGNDDLAIECLRFAMATRYRNFFLVEDKHNSMPATGDNSGSAFG